MSFQLSLFNEVIKIKGKCCECINCIPHEWYNERYRHCKARPAKTHEKCQLTVIKPNDEGCWLFKQI